MVLSLKCYSLYLVSHCVMYTINSTQLNFCQLSFEKYVSYFNFIVFSLFIITSSSLYIFVYSPLSSICVNLMIIFWCLYFCSYIQRNLIGIHLDMNEHTKQFNMNQYLSYDKIIFVWYTHLKMSTPRPISDQLDIRE